MLCANFLLNRILTVNKMLTPPMLGPTHEPKERTDAHMAETIAYVDNLFGNPCFLFIYRTTKSNVTLTRQRNQL